MADPVLELRQVLAGYDGRMVLAGVDLAVEAGRLTAIIGPNGHGKSTLLKTVSGLVRPTGGEIRHAGTRIDGMRPDQIVKRGIIQVPQGDLLFPAMTVNDNLLMGAYREAATGETASRLDFVFSLLPKLKERRNQVAGTLSGGERRMCGIGRGLMAGEGLLMLDEPSLGLAPIVIDQIYEVIIDLCRQGRTILLVEENASRIAGYAHMIHLLDNGRFVWAGGGAELMARPEIFETYLGA
jgi:branched-chain amino acid transport system ATP-binding protein